MAAAVRVFDCEVGFMCLFTRILVVIGIAEKHLRRWCLIHDSRASLSHTLVNAQSEMTRSKLLCLLSYLCSYHSKIIITLQFIGIALLVPTLLHLSQRLVITNKSLVTDLNLMNI